MFSDQRTFGGRGRCELDQGEHQRGIEISDAELFQGHFERSAFRGGWNYTVLLAEFVA